MRPGSSRPGGDRRTALVLATVRCIAEKGFEGLRLREVAAEVGINHATIHHYFATKEALVGAVVDHALARLAATMPGEGPAVEQLRTHLAALRRLVRDDPALFRVLHELGLRAVRDPAIRPMVQGMEDSWRGSLSALFERGIREGGWAIELDPAGAAALTMALVKGASEGPASAPGELEAATRQLERWIGLPQDAERPQAVPGR